jgi:hypothetical protein
MSPERRRKQLSQIKLETKGGEITSILTTSEQSEVKRFLSALYPKISMQLIEDLGEIGATVRFQTKGAAKDIQAAIQILNQSQQTAAGWVVMLLRIAESEYLNTNQDPPSVLTLTDTCGNYLRAATPEDYARFHYDVDALTANSLKLNDPGDAVLKQHLQDLLSVDAAHVISSTSAEIDIVFGP